MWAELRVLGTGNHTPAPLQRHASPSGTHLLVLALRISLPYLELPRMTHLYPPKMHMLKPAFPTAMV